MSTQESPVPINHVGVEAYTIPTDGPESDGTLEWDSTTLVLVHINAGGASGIGYTYAGIATAALIREKLAPLLHGSDALAINARWQDMVRTIRNMGRPGISSMAIAAVDNALWDLKAKLLNVSLAALLGSTRRAIPVYGSGGFTSYASERLQEQLGSWARGGMQMVKMKIGREPERDLARVREAREAIGTETQLFVDANGAYTRKQALAMAQQFAEYGVSWFEEPVSSDDLAGLHLLRERGPGGMAISAGEYGYDLPYFRRMLEAQAVDVLQADATRCAGITGFLGAAALCEAFGIPLSSHCAPALHLPLCCAARPAIHLEYFYDHARIEQMLFDGAITPDNGKLAPDLSRPGLGIEFKRQDARCYEV
ncbi:enolase C-terminal domain-like protein [Noviherbaspirillum sp.]|jgi:L-alanine-DL-glutamate epimerase-like enolase superfamily enzyme|uniref:enolase C-terminal domain-like protein n=1 Tax=Noviherbaspirillum sp. TaxID=1926288 RepID=UPI0025CD96FC|nr:enolase C-terminal domain-like protein [Noviherbaspirillum sp.]